MGRGETGQQQHAALAHVHALQTGVVQGAGAGEHLAAVVQAAGGGQDGLGAVVHADVLAAQGVGGLHGGAGAAAQVDDQIAGAHDGLEDTIQELQRLLGGVAGAFRVALLQVGDVRPDVAGVDGRVVIIAVNLAAGLDLGVGAAILIHAAAHVVLAVLGALQGDAAQVEMVVLRAGVEQDGVVLAGEVFLRAAAAFVAPDDLVEEELLAKDLVADDAAVGRGVPVQVDGQHAGLAEQRVGVLDQPAQEVQVSRLVLKFVCKSGELGGGTARLPASLTEAATAGEAVPGHEGRVDVHALGLAGIFRQHAG